MRLQRIFSSATGPATGFAIGTMCDSDGKVFFTTFETKPIPAGTYTARLLDHPIHGLCWEVCDVPGRTGILFHVGNGLDDSEGCVLVGLGFNGAGIIFSVDAYRRFRQFLAKLTEFEFIVRDPQP